MKIELTFVGLFSGETKTIVNDDLTSPSLGYTTTYAERVGKSYEESGRAEELLGDSDDWEFQSARILPRNKMKI